MVAYSQIKKAVATVQNQPTPTNTVVNPNVPKSTASVMAAKPVAASAVSSPTLGAVPKASTAASSMAKRLTNSKPVAASSALGAVPKPSTGISSQQVSSAIKNPATSTTQQNGPMDYYAALAQAQQQVNPTYQAAETSARQEGWQNNLNAGELASAQGGSHSGLAADLQNKVNINTSNTINNLQAQKAAQAAQLAQELVQQSQQNAFQEAQLTGFYKGKQTMDALNADRNYGLSYADIYGTGMDGKQTAAYQGQLFNQGLSREQQDLATKNANLNAALAVSDITGKVINPQSDWTGLFRQAGNSKTPLTLAGQNQQLNNTQVMAALTGFLPNGQKTSAQQAQELSQLWDAADRTGIIPDELANMYGLPSGTKTLQAKQFALQQWQAQDSSNLAWDDNSRQWSTLDYQMQNSGGGTEYSGMSANQVYNAAVSTFKNKDGKIPSDPTTKEAIYKQVGSAGLTQEQEDQIMVMMGLSKEEIAAFDQKYEIPSGK